MHPNLLIPKTKLQCLGTVCIDRLMHNPNVRVLVFSTFNYSAAGHIITGNVNMIENEDMESLILKGPKCRKPRSVNWRKNFIIIKNSIDDYAIYEKTNLIPCQNG